MKWIIISTIISLPFMFLFPDQPNEQDSQIIAQLQFNDACNSAFTHDCNINDFKSVYKQCTTVYGNITLEECRERCCNINQTLNQLNNLSNVLSIQNPSLP